MQLIASLHEINRQMKRILLSLLLFTSVGAFAQQDALFTQYTYNKLLVNAGYAGSRGDMDLTLLHRTQWVDIEGAPNTSTISLHTALKNRKVGVGFYMYRDEIGPTVNNTFMANYAYRIFFDRGSLSFGLQAGIKHYHFDRSKMHLEEVDPVLQGTKESQWEPDVNLGIYYQTDRFCVGISSTQLLENGYEIDGNDNSINKLARHFYVLGGYALPLKNNVIFRPSALLKFVPNAPAQVDFNASFIFNNLLTVGASYRTSSAITGLVEVKLNKKLTIGYAYDYYFNDLRTVNAGSHEFRLSYNFNIFKDRMKTARYF